MLYNSKYIKELTVKILPFSVSASILIAMVWLMTPTPKSPICKGLVPRVAVLGSAVAL
jgi:hypothetical protein